MNRKHNRDNIGIRLDDNFIKNKPKYIPLLSEISTSRKHSMDYFTKDGFILRTGYSDKREWYLLAIKEVMDNDIDFHWKYYKGENASINVNIAKDDTIFRVLIRNSNPRNIQVFQDLNAIFDFDMRYGSKQDVHVISRGMLGDAMKQILSLGYILIHISDDGTEFAERQWDYPLIIRHNKEEWKVHLYCNKAKQEYKIKIEQTSGNLTYTDTEIELTLPIIDEIRNTLDRSHIERFCRKYSLLTTDISFRFRIQTVDSNPTPQIHAPQSSKISSDASDTTEQDDSVLITQLVNALSKSLSNDVLKIEMPAFHPIATRKEWNNSDSIYSYTPEEFIRRITNVHNKELRTVHEVLLNFREGTNVKKNAKSKKSIAGLLTSPNMYKEIEELYGELKNALPPQRKISLPYTIKRKERIPAVISRIGKLYNIDKNQKPSYKIEHGYFYDGNIQYPFAFEILGIPLANPREDDTEFIGAINYSISSNNIKFEGEYNTGTQCIEGNIDDVLRYFGFHKYSSKKSRLPCVVFGNLITQRRDPNDYDKSRIDTYPFSETILTAIKKMASEIQTLRAAGYFMHTKDDDYRNARQKLINRKVSAKELLRQFLIKERGLPSND